MIALVFRCFMATAVATVAALSAQAQSGPAQWDGIVFFCSPPIPAQSWGDAACSAAEEEATNQAAALGVAIVSVAADRAGIEGGPQTGTAPFEWSSALRLLAQFNASASASYPWNMLILFYDYPPDASGERLESRYRSLRQQSVSLLAGDELAGARQTLQQLLSGLFAELFERK